MVVIRTPKYLQPNNPRLSDFTFGKLMVITELRYAVLTLLLTKKSDKEVNLEPTACKSNSLQQCYRITRTCKTHFHVDSFTYNEKGG